MITQSQTHLRRKPKAIDISMTTPPIASLSPSPPSFAPSSTSSFDESYFSRTYVPLSSLPTPPPSSHSNDCSLAQTPSIFSSAGEFLDPELLGPSIHLTNLIPTSASLIPPSVPLVHAVLTRACLPLEIIAMAVCLLDSLNSRFALQWRMACPLETSEGKEGGEGNGKGQYIDEVLPEVIVLGALVVADKFLDDKSQTTREYGERWGRGVWSCPQINFTQRALLENLGYRLLSLWTEEIIKEAKEDMERAAKQYWFYNKVEGEVVEEEEEEWWGEEREMSTGKAVLGMADSLTPAISPRGEDVRGTRDLGQGTKTAFGAGGSGVREMFKLRVRGGGEPFPLYVDQGIGGLGLEF